MKEYKCSLGLYAQLKLLAYVVITIWFGSIDIIMCLSGLVLGIVVYLETPFKIQIDDKAITIKKRSPVVINFEDIRSIKKVTAMGFDFSGSGRGTNIFISFGYSGARKNNFIGWASWYCTQLKNYVVIETDKNKFVISPDDQDGVIADIKHRHPALVLNEIT